MIQQRKKINLISINIKSFSPNILKFYINSFFLLINSKKINIKVQPTKHKKLTVLRSPHKYKKAQEHFELKIYKSIILVKDVNIAELLLLLNNKPEGVFINIKIKQILN